MEKLWNLNKRAVPMEKLGFGNSIYGKTMEFEQKSRTYGKTGIFGWKKKCELSLKKEGKIRPDFEMWFQCLLLRLFLH